MLRQPGLVHAANATPLAPVHDRATARGMARATARKMTRGMAAAVHYIEEMFKTGNDEDNHEAVLDAPADSLPLVGVAVYGHGNAVDKVVRGLLLHPTWRRRAAAACLSLRAAGRVNAGRPHGGPDPQD